MRSESHEVSQANSELLVKPPLTVQPRNVGLVVFMLRMFIACTGILRFRNRSSIPKVLARYGRDACATKLHLDRTILFDKLLLPSAPELRNLMDRANRNFAHSYRLELHSTA